MSYTFTKENRTVEMNPLSNDLFLGIGNNKRRNEFCSCHLYLMSIMSIIL